MAALTYTPEIAALICERMSKGESLRSICRDEGMPAESTVRFWATEDRDGFAAHYARAREAQMDALAEDIIEIADGAPESDEDVQRSRLRVDTRKWIMSKIAPKKYGDKLTLDGDLTMRTDPEEKRARLAELLAKAQGLQAGSGSVANHGADTTEDA